MGTEKCREMVSSSNAWRMSSCMNKAVTEAGYCRVHDPELRRLREAKRTPSKYERQMACRGQLKEFLRLRLSPEDFKVAMRGIVWGWVEYSNPPVDPDIMVDPKSGWGEK